MNIAGLAEQLQSTIEQFFPEKLPQDNIQLNYFRYGVGSPIGGEEDDPIPRFWWAQSKVEEAFNDLDFEKLCAGMECTGRGEIARSLRRHAESLLVKVRAASTSIQQERDGAEEAANKLCCDFIGAPLPKMRWGGLVGWTNLARGVFPDGSKMDGDPERRRALSASISEGPPGIWKLSLKLADDAKAYAEEYWKILHSANYEIRKIRVGVRSEVERVCAFLSIVENAGDGAGNGSAASFRPAAARREVKADLGKAATLPTPDSKAREPWRSPSERPSGPLTIGEIRNSVEALAAFLNSGVERVGKSGSPTRDLMEEVLETLADVRVAFANLPEDEARTLCEDFWHLLETPLQHDVASCLISLGCDPLPWTRFVANPTRERCNDAYATCEAASAVALHRLHPAGTKGTVGSDEAPGAKRQADTSGPRLSSGEAASQEDLEGRVTPSLDEAVTVPQLRDSAGPTRLEVSTTKQVTPSFDLGRLDRLEAAVVTTAAVAESTRAGFERVAQVIESQNAPAETAKPTVTDWIIVQGLLLAKRERGEPYTSLRKLMDELNCNSDSTIRKAIKRSETLVAWQKQSLGPKAAPRATDLAAVARDNIQQTTERAPDDFVPDDEVDATMAWLLDRAQPYEKAQLNALDDAQRRELVATYRAQNRDGEPSPLEGDKLGERARKVRQHKRP